MKTMHTIWRAVCFAIAASGLGLGSCVTDERLVGETHGVVRVEIAQSAGVLTRSDDETMNTVRLIVFTDLDVAPRVEINTLYRAGDGEFTVEPAVGATPAKVRFTLKVERRAGGTNEKLIVAVINEPSAPEMKVILDGIVTPADLEAVELDMSRFVAADHLSLIAAAPMTGALWTDRLFRTEGEASRTGNVHTLEVQRAVARVDVYLKRGADVETDLKMAAGSTVTLANTCAAGNLFYHSDGENTIGSVPTVASGFDTATWRYTGTAAREITETEPVCVFYTPEREHTADRLALDISIVTSEGAVRGGSLKITSARDDAGVEHAVDRILRNHIYKVTATIGVNGITADVEGWTDEEIDAYL